jgi:hypothetical protein
MGETERGELEARVLVTFYCENGHAESHSFARDAEVPDEWDCPKCGLPAGQDPENPPPAPRIEPYKTHLAYVKERRSDDDGAQILEEALEALRSRPRF